MSVARRLFKPVAVLALAVSLASLLGSIIAWREGLGNRYMLMAIIWLAAALWAAREAVWAFRRLS